MVLQRQIKGNRNLWSSFIADYILHSERLMLLCLLIDGRHPEMAIDKVAFDWLVEAGVPLQIVVTKADKLTAKEKSANLSNIKELCIQRLPADFVQLFKAYWT